MTSGLLVVVNGAAGSAEDEPVEAALAVLRSGTDVEVAATASGGATTAPSAKATANGTGRMSQVTNPTPSAVTTTNRTER